MVGSFSVLTGATTILAQWMLMYKEENGFVTLLHALAQTSIYLPEPEPGLDD
jgi:hypothetical protein